MGLPPTNDGNPPKNEIFAFQLPKLRALFPSIACKLACDVLIGERPSMLVKSVRHNLTPFFLNHVHTCC